MHRMNQRFLTLGAVGTSAVVVLVGCSASRDVAAPRESVSLTGAQIVGCDTVCVTAEGAAPFAAIPIPADSGDSQVLLARVVWDSVSSGRVRLRLVGAATLTATEAGQRIQLSGALTLSPTLAELAVGVEAPVGAGSDSLVLTILRLRSLQVSNATNVQLIVTSPKAPRSLTSPWPRRTSPVSALIVRNDAECDFSFPETECGGAVTATLSVVIPSVGNGTFQSFGGTNASRRMEIFFSSPVSSVTVTIHDPTFGGNSVNAINAAGALIDSKAFTGNNQPGVYSSDTRMVSATPLGGQISRVVLIPADADYVAYSFSFRLGEVEFTVMCLPSSVERAQMVTCEMKVSGGSALTAPEWEFDSPAISQDLPRPIRYPGASGSDAPSATWSGIMAVSGTVKGSVTVSGRRVSEQATITVTSRPWRASGVLAARPAVVYLGQGSHPPIPLVSTDLGHAYFSAPVLTCSDARRGCVSISSGPNRGLIFSSAFPLSLGLEVSINETALASNSTWRQSFPSSRINGRCSRSDVDGVNLRDLIVQHEGLNPDIHPNSHTRIFRDAMDSTGVTIMEAAVVGLVPSFDDLVTQAYDAAYKDAKQIDDSTSLRNPARLPCRLF